LGTTKKLRRVDPILFRGVGKASKQHFESEGKREYDADDDQLHIIEDHDEFSFSGVKTELKTKKF